MSAAVRVSGSRMSITTPSTRVMRPGLHCPWRVQHRMASSPDASSAARPETPWSFRYGPPFTRWCRVPGSAGRVRCGGGDLPRPCRRTAWRPGAALREPEVFLEGHLARLSVHDHARVHLRAGRELSVLPRGGAGHAA